MSDAPKRTPAHIAQHRIKEDSLEFAIFTLLRERVGEDLNGARSINAAKAIPALLVCAGHLLAGYPPNPRAAILNDFRRAVNQRGDAMAKEYRERQRN